MESNQKIAHIKARIYTLRGMQVMLDADLAVLYNVGTSTLNEQVKRNIERLPQEFMFQLTSAEFDSLISQIAISSWTINSEEATL